MVAWVSVVEASRRATVCNGPWFETVVPRDLGDRLVEKAPRRVNLLVGLGRDGDHFEGAGSRDRAGWRRPNVVKAQHERPGLVRDIFEVFQDAEAYYELPVVHSVHLRIIVKERVSGKGEGDGKGEWHGQGRVAWARARRSYVVKL